MFLVCAALKAMIFSPFGLKTGIAFAYFGLNSGKVLEGIRGSMNVFVVSIPNE